MMSPMCKYWGKGYPNVSYFRPNPKYPWCSHPWTSKPAHSLRVCCGDSAVVTGYAAWVVHHTQAFPEPGIYYMPWSWGGKGRGEKDSADKHTLASPNSLLGKVNSIRANCAYTRQSFSTVQLCPALPRVVPSWPPCTDMGGHTAPHRWWGDHESASQETQVLIPPL